MTKTVEVPLTVASDDFRNLKEGSYSLNAPFFDNDETGGAIQVGLQPDEYTDEQKREIVATIVESMTRRAITLTLADPTQPFNIQYTADAGNTYRQPILSHLVDSLTITETDGLWLGFEQPDGDDLTVVDREGFNFLAGVLAMYAHKKQSAAPNPSTDKNQ